MALEKPPRVCYESCLIDEGKPLDAVFPGGGIKPLQAAAFNRLLKNKIVQPNIHVFTENIGKRTRFM